MLKYRHLEYALLSLIILCVLIPLVLFTSSYTPYLILGIALLPIIIYCLAQIEGGFILGYLLLCITFLKNNEGIQATELPFYVFSLILIFYNILEVFRGNLILNTFIDKLYLVILLLVPYGIILGILNGSSLYLAFGETTYLLGLFVYFPLRKHLPRQSFRKAFYLIILIIIAYVLIRNFLNYRQILIQAVASWQTEKARVPSNEFVIMFGTLLFMGAALITKVRIHQIFYTMFFVVLLGGLILTQSRGYWLAFFGGVLTIFFLSDLKSRVRIVYTFLLLISLSILVAQFFFHDQFYLILKGLFARFNSIGSGKLDVSLYERLLESKAVFDEISRRPISGIGMGVTYTKKFVFYSYFSETSYIHNGYLGTWFKFGLTGLIIFPVLWVSLLFKSSQIFKTTNKTRTKIVMLSIAGTVSGVTLVNNTSPQVFNFVSCLFITFFSAIISTMNDQENG